MITRKTITIPIFDYRLSIIIYDQWDETKHLFDGGPEPRAIVKSYYGGAIVAINSTKETSMVHESEHIKNLIWEFIGYKPQEDNDEVDAYLITYIYNKISSVFYKHCKETI